MSPEEVSAKVDRMGGQVSPSYIRRVEKAEHSPTIETLDVILRALSSNLGLFFEYQIEAAADLAAHDRRYQRIIQRGLEGPHRDDVIATIRMIERSA